MTSSDTPTQEMDLSAGLHFKGIPIDNNTFFVATTFQQLRAITRDPALLQPGNKRAGGDPDIEQEQTLHELVQRALTGSKKSNVEKYSRYIQGIVEGSIVGVLPPMHLWCVEQLALVDQARTRYLLIPHGERLLAIDGETQLSAHWQLDQPDATTPEIRKRHRELPLGAIVHHGVPVKHARQYFHDLNVLAVRPNTSLSLGMDTQDPITQVIDDVEAAVPALTGRVEKMARQISKRSNKLVTLQGLRQMVVNIAKGIAGIQYGAKPVPLEGVDQADLTRVAIDWIGAYFNTFTTETSDRDAHLASSGAVLAAVGAIGQQILEARPSERSELRGRLIADLTQVDWTKGQHWVGIAGNLTSRGLFSVKGTKEVAYAVYAALTDPSSSGYRAVRQPANIRHDYLLPTENEQPHQKTPLPTAADETSPEEPSRAHGTENVPGW